MQKNLKNKEGLYQCIACLFLGVLSFILFYLLAGRSASDLSIHAAWASEGAFTNPRSFLHHQVHPLWHLGVGLLLLTGMPLQWAAALATTLWKLLTFWVTWQLSKSLLGPQRPAWLATACALTVSLVSCVCVPWFNPQVYLNVGTPNPWHSPTQLAVLPFSVVGIRMMAQSYVRFEALGPQKELFTRRQWLVLAALFALSALAKPSFLQAFLPGAALYFLVQWIRHPKGSRYFWQLIAAMVPAVLVVAVQFYFYFLNPTDTGLMFEFFPNKLWFRTMQLVMMALFPLFALVTDREYRQNRDPLVTLTILYVLCAWLQTLLLGESGRRAADGNLGWAMMGAAFILWAVMLPRFVRQQRSGSAGWRSWIGGAALAWHLLSGLYYIGLLLFTGAAM